MVNGVEIILSAVLWMGCMLHTCRGPFIYYDYAIETMLFFLRSDSYTEWSLIRKHTSLAYTP